MHKKIIIFRMWCSKFIASKLRQIDNINKNASMNILVPCKFIKMSCCSSTRVLYLYICVTIHR